MAIEIDRFVYRNTGAALKGPGGLLYFLAVGRKRENLEPILSEAGILAFGCSRDANVVAVHSPSVTSWV